MNLFQLILKQMRQRLLSTVLTCLSIVLGMSLVTSILVLQREGEEVFAQRDYGFNLLVGPKGAELPLVLNAVYHIGKSPGTISYKQYEMLSAGERLADGSLNPIRGMVLWAVPYAVGDTYRKRPIIATTPQLFGVGDQGNALPAERRPMYRRNRYYEFAAGKAFAPNRFEAVVGSQAAEELGLKIGDTFRASHAEDDEHKEEWKIVGILKKTYTANDNVLFIPLISFYAIDQHGKGLEFIANLQQTMPATAPTTTTAPFIVPATSRPLVMQEPEGDDHDHHDHAYHLNADGTIDLHVSKDLWQVSAILVQARPGSAQLQLQARYRTLPDAAGVQPALVMSDFFRNFLPATTTVLILISALVSVVAAISILVSIYNSVAARHRDIAIMRALGATRRRILAAICLEAGMIGLLGGVLGVVAGHLFAAVGSGYLQQRLGTGISWWQVGWLEAVGLAVIIGLSLLAGLYPGWKAYQVSVAENLANS